MPLYPLIRNNICQVTVSAKYPIVYVLFDCFVCISVYCCPTRWCVLCWYCLWFYDYSIKIL